MRRRDFLIATAAIATASAAPALAGLRRPAPGRSHHLLRLDAPTGHFLTDDAAAAAAPPGGPLRVHFERLIPARRGGLEALEVSVLFDSGAAEPWRHVAWRYRRGDVFGSSRGNSFVAMPRSLRALQFDYHDGVRAPRREHCACGIAGGLPLVPGRYLLAFAGGEAPACEPLRFSGDWQQPLAGTAAFDCLSVRIEAEAPGPDLSLRADLACLAAADACAPA